MNKAIVPVFVLAGAATIFLASAARSAPAPTVTAPAPAKAAMAAETSNVACYFRKDDGGISWQWGLTGSNQYFSFPGEWKSTTYTKLKKFFSTTAYATICEACNYAKTYYKEAGNLFAVFAASSGAGYNYPMVLGGNEISPNF